MKEGKKDTGERWKEERKERRKKERKQREKKYFDNLVSSVCFPHPLERKKTGPGNELGVLHLLPAA